MDKDLIEAEQERDLMESFGLADIGARIEDNKDWVFLALVVGVGLWYFVWR